jgi:hypothetical protein
VKKPAAGRKKGTPNSDRKPTDIMKLYMEYSHRLQSFFLANTAITMNARKNRADITALTVRPIIREPTDDLNAVDRSISTNIVHIATVVDMSIRLPCLYELASLGDFCFLIFAISDSITFLFRI